MRALILALLPALALGGTPVTTEPVVPLSRVQGQTVYNYQVSYQPIVAGSVTFDYFSPWNLAQTPVKPYYTRLEDSTKGPYYIAALTTFPVYVRITLVAADGSIPTQVQWWYLNPPKDPQLLRPAAPSNFKVAFAGLR